MCVPLTIGTTCQEGLQHVIQICFLQEMSTVRCSAKEKIVPEIHFQTKFQDIYKVQFVLALSH